MTQFEKQVWAAAFAASLIHSNNEVSEYTGEEQVLGAILDADAVVWDLRDSIKERGYMHKDEYLEEERRREHDADQDGKTESACPERGSRQGSE
jgi:hypothetical protein